MNLETLIDKGISYELQSVKADKPLVQDIQVQLNRIGVACGKPDGAWGKQTQSAWSIFVQSHKVTDARFTPKTAKLLLDLPTVTQFYRAINQAGVDLIKVFEGLSLQAYRCPAGVLTIGYGTTKGIKAGMTITQPVAEQMLKRDLHDFERVVERLVKVPLSDNQFAALASFVYNVGAGAFERSTLLKELNRGRYAEAADELLKWNKAGGKVLAGLTRRRGAERSLFLKP